MNITRWIARRAGSHLAQTTTRSTLSRHRRFASLDCSNTGSSGDQLPPIWNDTAQSVEIGQRELQNWIDQRESRLQILHKLIRPHQSVPKSQRARTRPLPEADAGPIPLMIFRQRYLNTPAHDSKASRAMLSAQLLRCTTPKDMLNVLVIVMTDIRPAMRQTLSRMESELTRAWYRCRDKASDPHVLRTILQFIGRFEMADLHVSDSIRRLAVKFAARCRDLDLMRRCLRKYKDHVGRMPDHTFRAIVAKCTIGKRALGAIRNGRWQTHHLRQVLTGFHAEDHLPEAERCHLQLFVDRRDWRYVHGYIAALGLAQAKEVLWEEWILFKNAPMHTQPKNLSDAPLRDWDSRIRAEHVFIEQLQIAGAHDKAWRIFAQSSITPARLKPDVLLELVRTANLAGPAASKLHKHLVTCYGDQQVPSGQLLESLCRLDCLDDDGHSVMSQENAAVVYDHLKGVIDWWPLDEMIIGNTPAGVTEARALHAAYTGERVDDSVD